MHHLLVDVDQLFFVIFACRQVLPSISISCLWELTSRHKSFNCTELRHRWNVSIRFCVIPFIFKVWRCCFCSLSRKQTQLLHWVLNLTSKKCFQLPRPKHFIFNWVTHKTKTVTSSTELQSQLKHEEQKLKTREFWSKHLFDFFREKKRKIEAHVWAALEWKVSNVKNSFNVSNVFLFETNYV